jgi:hypothetical protein
VTQIRSPVLLLPYFFWFTKIKRLSGTFSAIGREFLSTTRVFIAALCRAKMHDFTAYHERNGPIFRYMHTADRIAY